MVILSENLLVNYMALKRSRISVEWRKNNPSAPKNKRNKRNRVEVSIEEMREFIVQHLKRRSRWIKSPTRMKTAMNKQVKDLT